ncbi:hypothetical protein CBS101457_003045 [Exobasidium rhododendri]|nr:hypothetical protein CBS101457_003045 [Exobasidium rhododendri]
MKKIATSQTPKWYSGDNPNDPAMSFIVEQDPVGDSKAIIVTSNAIGDFSFSINLQGPNLSEKRWYDIKNVARTPAKCSINSDLDITAVSFYDKV